MGKAELIEPALPHAYGSASDAGSTAGKPVKVDFGHVSEGNWTDTLKAIEAFLVSKGERRQGYGADLIMFMERSFSGKYRNGERSHYQRIMPGGKWRKGDTLSEKLKRCKDKETFKGRFDRIGTTAILKREHFDNREITNLDFKGRMYLRLIDTNDNNRSLFFRNDALVDAFIKSAIVFNKDEVRARKYKTRRASMGKPEVVGVGKSEVVYRENPNPLLYTEVDSRRPSGKNKGNSLTLVYSFPNGKNKNQPQPWKGVIDKETSDCGFADKQAQIEAGLLPDTEGNAGVIRHTSPAKSFSGSDVFKLWHRAVSVKHPDECISANPTAKQIGQAATFYQRFNEFFPGDSIAGFFDSLTRNWIGACKDFNDGGVWQKFGPYPEIPSLLNHTNRVFTWYKAELRSTAKDEECNREGQERSAKQAQALPDRPGNYSARSVLQSGADGTQVSGRTHRYSRKKTIEHEIASEIRRKGSKYSDPGMEAFLREKLQKLSTDLAASEARIAELVAMTEDEFDECIG